MQYIWNKPWKLKKKILYASRIFNSGPAHPSPSMKCATTCKSDFHKQFPSVVCRCPSQLAVEFTVSARAHKEPLTDCRGGGGSARASARLAEVCHALMWNIWSSTPTPFMMPPRSRCLSSPPRHAWPKTGAPRTALTKTAFDLHENEITATREIHDQYLKIVDDTFLHLKQMALWEGYRKHLKIDEKQVSGRGPKFAGVTQSCD